MKVVINTRYGGFGLSVEAVLKLYEMADPHIKAVLKEEYFGKDDYWKASYPSREAYIQAHIKFCETAEIDGKILLDEHKGNEHRDCPLLVRIVEEMGTAANGQHAELKIVEIPDGTDFVIEEYDGREWISEAHETWS